MRVSPKVIGWVVVSAGLATAGGCTFNAKSSLAGGDVSGTGSADGAGGSGTGGWMRPASPDAGGFGGLIGTGLTQDAGEPNDDANCGLAMVSLAKLPPEILVVLDRSGSMDENAVTGMNCPNNDPLCLSKWDDMTAGLAEVFTATDGSVNWGLKLFGSIMNMGGRNGNSMQCVVTDGAEVPIGPANAVAMNTRIAMTTTGSATPTTAAMTKAAAYLATLTTPNPKFILLATDGEPTCLDNGGSTSDATAAIAAVGAAAAAGFPTFVVGIATSTDPTAGMTLASMAMQGGRARNADPPYYPVTTRADLVTALGEIGRATASCTMSLATPPPDPNNVGVRVMGDQKIPRDTTHAEGWDYGAGQTSIVLYGSYCTKAMDGTYTDVRALFGCPDVIID